MAESIRHRVRLRALAELLRVPGRPESRTGVFCLALPQTQHCLAFWGHCLSEQGETTALSRGADSQGPPDMVEVGSPMQRAKRTAEGR